MAVASQSFLQDLGNAAIVAATSNNYNNIVMCCGGDDDDDDASFEVIGEVPNALYDINLAEALSSLQRDDTFTGPYNVNSSLDDEGDTTTDSGSTSEKTETNSLKQELRAKIQTKRLSQGVGELTVTFDPPKTYPLSPNEQRKVERRKQRNRDSANKSRLKRKQYEEELLMEVKKLQKDNEALESEIKTTKEFRRTLQRHLDRHLATCTYHPMVTTSASSTASVVDSRDLGNIPGTFVS